MTRSVCNFIWYRMHLHWSHLKNLMLEFYKTIVLWLKLLFHIKGTLFVFIWKQYSENFIFLILRILKLFTLKFVNVSKSMLIFIAFFFVCIFHISHVRISQNVKGVLMRNLWHIIFMWRWRYWQILKSALSFRT